MRAISSRQNQAVALYRAAARGEAGAGLLLDGAHLVSEGLAAGLHLRHCIVASDSIEEPAMQTLLAEATSRGVELVTATAPVMSAVSPVASASAIVALADPPTHTAHPFAKPGTLVIVACDIQDPGNLGAIVRVAEAAGAAGVVTAGSGADPLGWKALRGSMGSALRLPMTREVSAAAAADAARRHSFAVAATVPRGGTPIYETDLRSGMALFIGGEGPGLPQTILDEAEVRLTIPMQSPVESLNAAVTAALIAYEWRRQRGAA